jgi:hypothetical protein
MTCHFVLETVKAAARSAADLCAQRGSDIAKLALQFSCANPDITSTIAGSANPANIRRWIQAQGTGPVAGQLFWRSHAGVAYRIQRQGTLGGVWETVGEPVPGYQCVTQIAVGPGLYRIQATRNE